MARWKRLGVLIVLHAFDHSPKHVHVYEDGKRAAKFDIEHWVVMEGMLSAKTKKALNALRAEGVI